jgi:hypothetical protein
MQKVNWMVVGVISIVVVLLLFGGGMMMGGWGYGSGSMMGSWGNGGYGMMNNWGYSPFGWIGMLFMWLIPIGLIALAVFGVVWLVRKAGNAKPPSA